MTSPRTATAGWALAASVYLLAVLHRTSLGVAGLLAERRFDISPAQLSIFIFLQLGVYAAMQIPAGILVDRYGPRRTLLTAAVIMGGAQLLFALVPFYPAALFARAALGCGDALTFISVLRFAATHFSARRYPLLVALTAMMGTIGNIAATLPLALALRTIGWAPVFGATAALSLLVAVVVGALLPDSTPKPSAVRSRAELQTGVSSVRERVRTAWSMPGTRLGFWTHFTAMSTVTAFGVLWGTPYLVGAVGLTTACAGGVLMAGVIVAAIAGPALGWLVGHRPAVRVPIALGISGATVTGFVVLVTVFGDRPPAAYVVPLFVFMALGSPASMAAFALARDYNHQRTLGTASGVVNVGGFLATVVVALGIGAVLDAMGDSTGHSLRWAVLVAVVVQGFGGLRTVVWWLRVRSGALQRQARGESVPVNVVRRRWDLGDPPREDLGDAPDPATHPAIAGSGAGSGRMAR